MIRAAGAALWRKAEPALWLLKDYADLVVIVGVSWLMVSTLAHTGR